MDKMKRLKEAMRMLMEGEFSGYIKINFSQGSLGRVEKYEELENAEIMLLEEKKKANNNIKIQNVFLLALLLLPVLACGAVEGVPHNGPVKLQNGRTGGTLICDVAVKNVEDAKPVNNGVRV